MSPTGAKFPECVDHHVAGECDVESAEPHVLASMGLHCFLNSTTHMHTQKMRVSVEHQTLIGAHPGLEVI